MASPRLGLAFLVTGAILLASSSSALAANRYSLHSERGSYQADAAAALAQGAFCRQPPGSRATPDAPSKSVSATAAAGGEPGPYCQGQLFWPSWGLDPAYTARVTTACLDLYVSGTSGTFRAYLVSRSGISEDVSAVSAPVAYGPDGIVHVQHKMSVSVGNVVAFGVGNVPPGWPSGTHPNLYVHYDSDRFPSSVTVRCTEGRLLALKHRRLLLSITAARATGGIPL